MAKTRRIQARPRGQGTGWLAIVGYAALGLGCVLLAMATFIFVAAPIDGVRDRLVQDIKARTGRDFVVSGPTSLTLFPRLAVSFAHVSLSAPPGMGGEPTLKAQTLEAEVGPAVAACRRTPRSGGSWSRGRSSSCESTRRAGAAGTLLQPTRGGCGWRRRPPGRRTRRRNTGGLHRAERSLPRRSRSCSRPACASSTAPCATSTSVPGCATSSRRSSWSLSPTTSAARSTPRAISPGAARRWRSWGRCRRSAPCWRSERVG